jgi:hypothetical protein
MQNALMSKHAKHLRFMMRAIEIDHEISAMREEIEKLTEPNWFA